jgi:hypothetical protein
MLDTVFAPVASASLAVGTTSGNVAIPGSFASSQRRTVRLFNDGAVTTHVEFGASGVTASTTTSMALAPNSVEVFAPQNGHTHIAAIAASGSATLRISAGEGK